MDNNPHEFVHEDHRASQESVRAGYEVSDMNVRLMVYSVVGLFILLFSGVLFGVVYLRFMESSTKPLPSRSNYPMLESVQVVKPFPELQQDPKKDKDAILGAAEKHLNSYGEVKTEDGGEEHVVHAHIPVARAMELLAAGKAPYRQAPKIALEAEAVADDTSEGF